MPAAADVPALEGVITNLWLKTPRPKTTAIGRLLVFLGAAPPSEARPIDAGPFFDRAEASSRTVAFSSMGLAGSEEYHRIAKLGMDDRLKRALLAQSVAHNRALAAEFQDSASLRAEGCALFGENLTVDEALNSDTVCLGDVFEVPRTGQRLEVTNPRRPCSRVDFLHGNGVRKRSAVEGRAGIFFRPLGRGSLAAGDRLVLVERPRPGLTLRRVCSAVYGHGLADLPGYSVKIWNMKRGGGPLPPEQVRELLHLRSCGELPDYEWMAVVDELLQAEGHGPGRSAEKRPEATWSLSRSAPTMVLAVSVGLGAVALSLLATKAKALKA